jgi:hypothetical protein
LCLKGRRRKAVREVSRAVVVGAPPTKGKTEGRELPPEGVEMRKGDGTIPGE